MIKAKGIWAYKTSDRFQSGVPDIYIAGGNWIECKAIGIRKTFNWHNTHTQEQLNFAAHLRSSGDRVLAASVWTIQSRIFFIIIPWEVLSIKPVWTRAEIKEWGYPYSKIENWMDMFNLDHNRHYDLSWETQIKEQWS
jgi:hypothetical protein